MRHRYGMIHGRFQPFHNGHWEYTQAALARCDLLIIGITNPDPSLVVYEPADNGRHLPEANPFTFFERQRMVQATLLEANVPLFRVAIVPFPIHHPERWASYCPAETVQFLRLFSAWGNEKLRRFQDNGWSVEVLDEGVAKEVSGTEIRRRLRAGQGWEELVPPGTASVLRAIGAEERARKVVSIG
ncbi:MAG: adenylyltransferase/cytidyltransferase family protein [Deltaproteobacteria bacterium]|nr:adenylyltransferase/cytidyltransferase family protein [Deltaproteobacteria bacterium]